MRLLVAGVIALVVAGTGLGWAATHSLQHGVAQGIRVDVFAPGRAVFDLTRAGKGARQHLRGPRVAAGCVKARVRHGRWRAAEVFGPPARLGARLRVDLAVPAGSASSLTAPYDGCEIGGFYGHQWNDAWGTRTAVEIWLSPNGRHFFNDRAAARDLAYFVRSRRVHEARLSADPEPGLTWFVRRYPGRVVELHGPSARVPKDVIGFFVSPRTILFTATSSTGRRLFVVAERGSYRLPADNLGDLALVF